jgi:hypothetical protein
MLDQLDAFSHSEQRRLVIESRVFATSTPDGFGGHIVTDEPEDWRGAEAAALCRPYGETVDGIVCDLNTIHSN